MGEIEEQAMQNEKPSNFICNKRNHFIRTEWQFEWRKHKRIAEVSTLFVTLETHRFSLYNCAAEKKCANQSHFRRANGWNVILARQTNKWKENEAQMGRAIKKELFRWKSVINIIVCRFVICSGISDCCHLARKTDDRPKQFPNINNHIIIDWLMMNKAFQIELLSSRDSFACARTESVVKSKII